MKSKNMIKSKERVRCPYRKCKSKHGVGTKILKEHIRLEENLRKNRSYKNKDTSKMIMKNSPFWLSMSGYTKKCPYCKKPVSPNDTGCPHCGKAFRLDSSGRPKTLSRGMYE